MAPQKIAWKRASSTILFHAHLRRVLMLRRGPGARFMPNSLVFPGGVLDETDVTFPREKSNFDEKNAKLDNELTNVGSDGEDFALRVCAIRELFEESGLLPVVERGRRSVFSAREDALLREWRKRIVSEPTLFPQLFSDRLQMDIASLVPWANWLTPLKQKSLSRYDTTFFLLPLTVSSLPAAEHCTAEMTEAIWAEPVQIIQQSSESQISLPPPQFYELSRLIHSPTPYQKGNNNLKRITPHVCHCEENPDSFVHLLPGDFLYDENNPDFTPPSLKTGKELLPPYPDDVHKPIHRLTFRSNPPLLEYHKMALHVKNCPQFQSEFPVHNFY